jgi:subtilase family serine protease
MKSRRLSLAVFAVAVLALLVSAAPAHALADLEITVLGVQGAARVGACNSLYMTVKNHGDAVTGSATLDIRVITFASGTPYKHAAQRDLSVNPPQPGAQFAFTVANVEFLTAGAATIQAVVDSTDETPESNEKNNTVTVTTTVSGSCAPPPSSAPLSAGPGCDLSLTFIAPTGSTVPAGSPTFTLRANNEGSANCQSTKLRLYRHNGSTPTGYGSAVGGTRNTWTIPALAPGQSADYDFTDEVVKGTYTYAPKFLGTWNDASRNSPGPAKTVTVQ